MSVTRSFSICVLQLVKKEGKWRFNTSEKCIHSFVQTTSMRETAWKIWAQMGGYN
jgi:hypothetical protein